MAAHEKQNSKEYDWIDDPFDEKKAAQEQEQAHTSTGMRIAIVCIVAAIIIGIIIMVVLLFMGTMSVSS